jgi:hypothetical protein
MKKSLKDYLILTKKHYPFVLKLAFEPSKDEIEKVKKMLEKYSLVSFSKPIKTIIRSSVPEFPTLSNIETYVYDFVVDYPVLDVFLQNEIAVLLKISPQRVYVGKESTIRQEHEDQLNKKVEEEDNESPAVSTDYYGDKYNELMVKTLKNDLPARYTEFKIK